MWTSSKSNSSSHRGRWTLNSRVTMELAMKLLRRGYSRQSTSLARPRHSSGNSGILNLPWQSTSSSQPAQIARKHKNSLHCLKFLITTSWTKLGRVSTWNGDQTISGVAGISWMTSWALAESLMSTPRTAAISASLSPRQSRLSRCIEQVWGNLSWLIHLLTGVSALLKMLRLARGQSF